MSTDEPMSVEDRVRAATRAGATLVRDIGPMTAEPEQVRFRRRPAPAARRWGFWGVPLAAAAAVALLALSLVAVRQFGRTAPAPGQAVTPAATAPRYYVALDEREASSAGTTGSGALIVGDDRTGQAIATVDPPRGVHFNSVAGASDDRTFVVRGSSGTPSGAGPESWYLLRIAPGTAHPYQLSALAVKLAGSSPTGVADALSPDDRELAIESIGNSSGGGFLGSDVPTTLGVYSVSSGAELRAWTSELGSGPGTLTLSWLSDGRQLAFSDVPPGGDRTGPLEIQLRTVDVSAPGTNLLAASHLVLTLKTPGSSPSSCLSLYLTPDGGTAICGTRYAFVDGGPGTNAGCAHGGLRFTAYSARTGRPVRVLYERQGACHNGLAAVLWTDSSASSIIGATETDPANEGGQQAGQLGVITDGRLRPLKLPKSVSPDDYLAIAF